MDKALVFVHLTCLFALSLDISNELFYVHYDIHDDDNPGSTMIYFQFIYGCFIRFQLEHRNWALRTGIVYKDN